MDSVNWSTDLPWHTMGLPLDKPIENWKFPKLRLHLIHFIYQTSELSLTHFKRAQNTYISLQLGKTI